MGQCIFVCIGTDKLISDSFGPRVGEKLTQYFKGNEKIKIYGTMREPIHFKNAKQLAKLIKPYEQQNIIAIDSAYGEEQNIGDTYINFGGIEIGKAYNKSFYFPAHINIKTVIMNKNTKTLWTAEQIDQLASKVARNIATNALSFVIPT